MIVVLAVLFVSYATSLRAWLEQRAHIQELETRIASSQRRVAELREEKRRWKDPAYVEAQARQRFGWVLPGEIGFRVIGADGQPLEVGSELTDPASLGRDPDAEWWSKAWGSMRVAGSTSSAERQGPMPADQLGPAPDRGRQHDRQHDRLGGARRAR